MIVGGGAVIYDGIRHLLFLVPALLAVPAVALAMLDRRPGMKPRVRSLLAGGAVIVVAASLFASIRWAPYSYAFINPVAGHDGDSRSWELDYWGVTGREGVTRLEKLGLSPVYVSPTPRVGVAWGANRGGNPSGWEGRALHLSPRSPPDELRLHGPLHDHARWPHPGNGRALHGCHSARAVARNAHADGAELTNASGTVGAAVPG